jgi:AraC-like DNA-binding protein
MGATEPPPFPLTVAYMAAYTIASLVVLARAWIRVGFGSRLAWPASILATMTAIHLAQVVRLTSDSPAVQDIVAAVGAVAVFGLLTLALAGMMPWAVGVANRYTRSSVSREDLRAAFDAMKSALRDQEMFRRPDLRLADVAGAVGLSSHQASQALSQGGGLSFHELVAEFRVAEAKRLLAEPENASVAVEPLGMMAGFRSRSAFYQTFQKALGQTPAEYRRRVLADNRVRSNRAGHGNARA